MLFLQMSLSPWRLVGAAAAWPVSSQQRACRNALVSATALAQLRRERLDVEEYLAVQDAGHPAPTKGVRHSA